MGTVNSGQWTVINGGRGAENMGQSVDRVWTVDGEQGTEKNGIRRRQNPAPHTRTDKTRRDKTGEKEHGRPD